ncbi:hypothetical protein FRC15_003820 [Serendipita sp. 397]|nr:hypothetical protein FRC15_003820 [Serendipita sp. 397]
MIPITKYSKIGHICVTTRFIRPSGAIFLSPLVLETVVFAMTAFKVYQAAKISPTHLPPLLHVLFRDGLVYYVVIFCARTLCIIIFFALPFQFMLLGINFLWAIVATMITRFFLNLRIVSRLEEGDFSLGNSKNVREWPSFLPTTQIGGWQKLQS